MFARRGGQRMNRGRVQQQSGGAAPVTPLSILGSLAWWVRADLGITIGTGVSAWADQSGNGVNFTQGTGSAQPAFVAGAVNGQPAVRGDGVDDLLAATWARAAPGTQPFYLWFVLKQISWSLGRTIAGDYNSTIPAGFIIDLPGASPNIEQFNGALANSNGGAAVSSYARVEMQFGNSIADYVKAGASAVTGANAGNLAGGGTVQLFHGGPGPAGVGASANVEIAEAFAFLGTPTVGQRVALDAYCTARYGAGLV